MVRQRVRHGWLRLITRLPVGVTREAVAVYRRLAGVRLVGLSAEVGFFSALALVPLALGVIGVVAQLDAFFPADVSATEQVQRAVEELVRLTFVGDARVGMLDTVRSLFDSDPNLLSVSIVSLLFLASRGFSATIRGLTLMYGTDEDRPWWHDRLAAFAFAALFIVVVGFSLAAFVVGPFLGRAIDVASRAGLTAAAQVWSVVRWFVLLAGLSSGLAALYHYCRRGHGRWVRDLPGAVLATAGLVLVAIGYRLYLEASPGLGLTGGAAAVGAVLGGFLATMVLLALIAAVILAGGAFNAEHDPDVPEVDELLGE